MPSGLMDQGGYLTLELIGTEHVDRSIVYEGSNLEYSGLFVGLVVENHSNETCRWDQDALEFIDTSGFTYVEKGGWLLHYLDEWIPGGWHNDLRDLKPNRKYRFITYISDFHGELGIISFEKETHRVVQTKDIDDRNQVERIEIDVSRLPEDEIAGLPEIIDALDEHS
jgi:hypothetical protein